MLVEAEAAIFALAATAEAAVLPFVSGFQEDGQNVVGTQAGAAGMASITFPAALRVAQYAGTDAAQIAWKPKESRVLAAHVDRQNLLLYDKGTVAAIYAALAWLGVGLVLIQSLELLSGFGLPNPGDQFKDGSAAFGTDISLILRNAHPSDGWSGAGALKYNHQNNLQQTRIAALAQADERISGLLKRQGTEVEEARLHLASIRLAIVGALAICGTFWASWNYYMESGAFAIAESIANSAAFFAFTCILLACPAAIGLISALVNAGTRHGDRIRNATRDGYRWVIDDVHRTIPHSVAAAELRVGTAWAPVNGP